MQFKPLDCLTQSSYFKIKLPPTAFEDHPFTTLSSFEHLIFSFSIQCLSKTRTSFSVPFRHTGTQAQILSKSYNHHFFPTVVLFVFCFPIWLSYYSSSLRRHYFFFFFRILFFSSSYPSNIFFLYLPSCANIGMIFFCPRIPVFWQLLWCFVPSGARGAERHKKRGGLNVYLDLGR